MMKPLFEKPLKRLFGESARLSASVMIYDANVPFNELFEQADSQGSSAYNLGTHEYLICKPNSCDDMNISDYTLPPIVGETEGQIVVEQQVPGKIYHVALSERVAGSDQGVLHSLEFNVKLVDQDVYVITDLNDSGSDLGISNVPKVFMSKLIKTCQSYQRPPETDPQRSPEFKPR